MSFFPASLENLIDKYMPNLQEVFEKYPEYRTMCTAPDGHIYSFDYKRNNLLSILKFAMNYSTDIAEFDSEKLAEAILSIEEWKND